jgi:ABC-type glutathione transport system ATPase component
MIRDAPVLLLDEPTTGLDAHSINRIMTPLRRLMAGRTTIIVSHNLLTVTDADQIVLLHHGRIIGTGTHHQFLATNAAYGRLLHAHHLVSTDHVSNTHHPDHPAGPRRASADPAVGEIVAGSPVGPGPPPSHGGGHSPNPAETTRAAPRAEQLRERARLLLLTALILLTAMGLVYALSSPWQSG